MAAARPGSGDTSDFALVDTDRDADRGPADPPPQWDGLDVARNWKKYKRELLLWRGDTRLAPRRQGLKVWRRMVGKAADIAELIPDSKIQDEDGVNHIIKHFEERYAEVIAATTDAELDDLIYQGVRASANTFGEYIQDVQTAWDKYEKAIRPETLPPG